MEKQTDSEFYDTAISLGLSEQRADILTRRANGDSCSEISYDIGVNNITDPLTKTYRILEAKNCCHAIAIVFETMLRRREHGTKE